jgi:DNA (cytosine-5)-methyltransferase 1
MRYLSVCSGIEAASVAWSPLGWKPVAFSEIETFPCSVLAERYPDVPNLGDMTRYEEWDINETVDLLVGGTPCQSFSIAGLRGGIEDARGNLALIYCRILQKLRPRWFVWENVPGVLSSSGGRDFGSILGAMVELGYGVAYRVLDAQYFGVPQRRRRVFIVGCLGDWASAAEVLFEPGCLRGDSKASSKPRKEIAGTLSSGFAGRGVDMDQIANGNCVVTSTGNTAHCLNAGGMGRQDYETETMVVGALQSGGTSKGHGTAGVNNQAVAAGHVIPAKSAGPEIGVRRLTPIECERLQGFPDDWTAVMHRNKPAADGPRYKAIGNSMAVPVMAWIGKRIQEMEGRDGK